MKHKVLFYIGISLMLWGLAHTTYSQSPHAYGQRIAEAKAENRAFDKVTGLFTATSNAGKNLRTSLKNARYFSFNKSISEQVINNAAAYIALEIPASAQSAAMTLELKKVPETFMSYKVTTASGKTYPKRASAKQVHYRGVVQGKEGSSLVALSVFGEEVMGFVSIEGSKTINIAKLKGQDYHALFHDDAFETNTTDLGCETVSDKQNEMLDEIYSGLNKNASARVKSAGKCLKVYFETDFGIYQNLSNSVANVENFVTGMFNEVATLYDNDGINIEISEIFVWDVADSYSSSISTGLTNFVAARPTFNGDLAHLLSFVNGDNNPNNLSNAGGRANGIGGLCVTGDSNLSPHSHTVLFPAFVAVPTFSRQVKVVTHEMGHNLGSRHTHACVWNGNNTAIDGCAGFTEGGCAVPGLPPGGGTIMSYCDRTSVGIDFNLGFGAQPTAVMQNMINNAACVDACTDCTPDLVITQNVLNGQNDAQEAGNTITASNTIFNGGVANYQAGSAILLVPGFFAQSGSNATLVIAPCSNDMAPSTTNQLVKRQLAPATTTDIDNTELSLYPNPTGGSFTIAVPVVTTTRADKARQSLEVYTMLGTLVLRKLVRNGERIAVDLTKRPKGIYLVKYISNGQVTIKKVVYK
ncbi:zinc-dependent metalloprotease [uncultured Microscilla sp.]|uniref:zinc-dependent metalloprotease n=1 Tax=uncultured Microscilla sp. TaxID=432653 RepID=UPI00260F8AF0|nr:zinc-dependent metalloprotease [uncultured Microscilla sp.]